MKRTYPIFISALLSCLIPSLLVPISLAASIPALDRADSEPLNNLPQADSGWSVVRIYYSDPSQLTSIAGRLDIWENYPEKGYAIAALTPEEFRRLQNLGYRLEVEAEKTAQAAPQVVLDPRFHYFDNYVNNANGLYVVDFLLDTNLAYPTLTELIDLGDAWQAMHGGYHRDIWALRISNEDVVFGAIEDKPVFILFAGIHAREVATPELAIRYIRYLLEGYSGVGGYGIDPDATWLVDNHVVYVIVMQNPDGHVPNEQNTGANRRKNMDSDDGCTLPSYWGVDLNRNHSFYWGTDNSGSSPYPCDETYRGPSAVSEPETQAFQEFFASVIPDQNGPNGDFTIPPAAPDNTTGIFLSLHSYSDLVLWPWTFNPPPANEVQLSAIGRKLAYYTGLTPSGGIGYPVNGATDDWTYGKFGIASFTFEIGSSGGTCGGFFPSFDCIDGNGLRSFWQETYPAFLYMHKIARTPYLTVYGPDSEDVYANPGVVSPGNLATLSATISDHRYGSDPPAQIAGAEYFIDAPGADGTGIPLSPADGAWGGLSEAVTGSIDTSTLQQGRHTLLAHGRSASGEWGPLTGTFLYVMQPGVAPVIEGYVRQAGTNFPLAATISAGVFQTTTDPNSGYYSLPVVSGTYTLQATAAGHVSAQASDVVASDYQIIQQDFWLDPLCSAFGDDVESGNQGWIASSPWAITTETAHSPTHSWTESPGGEYGDNRNTALTSPVLDLSSFSDISLTFWHKYATEAGFDFGYVEYSTNGGFSWTTAQVYDGLQATWSEVTLPLPALDGETDARIRFRFTSDGAVTDDGWHIDDIVVLGSGPNCAVAAAPIAGFSYLTPVVAGQPVQFTNLTVGTEPITYTWDFGDHSATSDIFNPLHTYTLTGTYTAALSAFNALGSDTFSQTLQVEPCVDISAITLSQVTPDPVVSTDLVEFSIDLSPDNAYKPYSYSLDFGDGMAPLSGEQRDDPLVRAHAFAAPGNYQISAQVSNCAMSAPLTDTLQLNVLERHGMTLLPAVSNLIGDPGSVVTHTLQLTNIGDTSDTFTVTLSSSTWASTLTTATLTLPPGDTASMGVHVVVPQGAAGGDTDNLTVSVESSFAGTPPASAVVNTSAIHIYQLALDVPVIQRLGHPGEVITYTVEIHNTGNSTDIYDIATSGAAWVVSASPNPATIPAGGSQSVEIWVVIPASASGGMDIVQITVRSRGDAAQNASTALTTSADWRIYLARLAR